jgi:hypothetical protein
MQTKIVPTRSRSITVRRALWRALATRMWRDFSEARARLWRDWLGGERVYRPELHYMRGPGPAWHAKYGHLAVVQHSTRKAQDGAHLHLNSAGLVRSP